MTLFMYLHKYAYIVSGITDVVAVLVLLIFLLAQCSIMTSHAKNSQYGETPSCHLNVSEKDADRSRKSLVIIMIMLSNP